MRISTIRLIPVVVAMLCPTWMSMQSQAPKSTFVIAVNPANKFTGAPSVVKNTVRRLYLRDWSAWPNGKPVRAFGRKAGSGEQQAFKRSVLAMTSAEMARHWLSKKNQHGLTPPKAVSSDRLMVKYVKKYSGAFAILRRDVAKKHGLRVLLPL